MNIFEITSDYLKIMEMAQDAETDDEALQEAMDQVGGELADKVDAYAVVRKQLKMEQEAADAERKAFTDKARARKNALSRIDRILLTTMRALGHDKLCGTSYKCWVQKNPKKVVYTTEDLTTIPEEYILYKPEINREAVKAALDEGTELTFAHYEQDEGIRFR